MSDKWLSTIVSMGADSSERLARHSAAVAKSMVPDRLAWPTNWNGRLSLKQLALFAVSSIVVTAFLKSHSSNDAGPMQYRRRESKTSFISGNLSTMDANAFWRRRISSEVPVSAAARCYA